MTQTQEIRTCREGRHSEGPHEIQGCFPKNVPGVGCVMQRWDVVGHVGVALGGVGVGLNDLFYNLHSTFYK